MYIPVVSETCRAVVIASQIIFVLLACAKVIWKEEQCYAGIRKAIKTMFMCDDGTTMRCIYTLRTIEAIGLVSWVIWLTQPKM